MRRWRVDEADERKVVGVAKNLDWPEVRERRGEGAKDVGIDDYGFGRGRCGRRMSKGNLR